MNFNMREKAYAHLDYINVEYQDEIMQSINKSKIYSLNKFKPVLVSKPKDKKRIVVDMDSVSALFKYAEGRTCVLNFASYTKPGGGFLSGMTTQEEALCHESTLFPVLKAFEDTYYTQNKQYKNKALYFNQAIYSPDIVFEDKVGHVIKADVLTCASPNYTVAKRFYDISFCVNNATMKNRVKFMSNILAYEGIDTLIAGAWGCGVFGQDSYIVAAAMDQYFEDIPNLVYAIPDNESTNYKAFKEVIKEI